MPCSPFLGLRFPQPDATVQRIVGSWPNAFAAENAKRMGFVSDVCFKDIIEGYLEEVAA